MLDDKLLGSDEEMLDEYKDVLENDKNDKNENNEKEDIKQVDEHIQPKDNDNNDNSTNRNITTNQNELDIIDSLFNEIEQETRIHQEKEKQKQKETQPITSPIVQNTSSTPTSNVKKKYCQ